VADGVDQDCNGGELCYLDNDGDGYRPNETATVASADLDCTDAREARGAAPTTDCNDNSAAINPGVDTDGDGLNACLDCVDSDSRIPGGLITLTVSTASVENGNNRINDAISDTQPTTQNFRASSAVVARVADVNVRVNLNHTWDGDLVLSMISPSGTVVALSTNNGSSGDNYSTTLFDDEAATAISSGSAPFNGSYRPSSPLNAFDTQTMSGNWTLRVADTQPRDTGSMTSWSVDFTTACP
jgi:subtilisin-like proprotein convertase family protein